MARLSSGPEIPNAKTDLNQTQALSYGVAVPGPVQMSLQIENADPSESEILIRDWPMGAYARAISGNSAHACVW